MKIILLFFTFLITTFGYGQFNSDREAYLSLLNKLQKDPKRIYENSNSTAESASFVNFKMINGEEKLINLKISYIGFNNIQNPNNTARTIDLTPELKQLNIAESLIIAANTNFSLNGGINTYQINFDDLSNSVNLTELVFRTGMNDNAQLQVINLSKIYKIPNLTTLGLHSLKIDEGVYSTLESTTQYKIKEFSISPFKQNNELITNFNFSSLENSLEKLTIEDFNGNLNNNFFSNLPNLKSFTHIGRFDTFPSNLSNSQNLEEMVLESYSGFNTLPSQIANLVNLKSLTIRTNQLQLPSTLSDLKNLKSFEIRQSTTDGLEPITNLVSLNKLTISFNYASQKELDFQKLVKLSDLEYKYYPNQTDDYNNYTLPNNLNKLINLEYLDISVGKIPVETNKFSNLKLLLVEYINPDLFPKINFSTNSNLEYLGFNNYFIDDQTKILKTPRIKFDKDFEKLSKLSYIDFWNVPIELDVTNKFNKLFNATHPDPNVSLLKYLSFDNLKSDIPNNLDGTLNLCNNHDIYLYIAGNSPKIIDYRNKSLTNKTYFNLDLDTDNPLIIVDDINKFKQTFGETYYNSTTQTNVAFNLTTSSEPCERTLSTNNLTKSDVKIYPNPVVDVLNIETDTNKNSIKIIDLTGKVIDIYSINDKKTSINVNHLPKGIYMIEVENEKGKTISKFIKK